MKIALITREFSPITRNGGIGTAMKHLAPGLASLGNEVTVYYSGRPSLYSLKRGFSWKSPDIQVKQIISPLGLLLRSPALRSRAVLNVLKNSHFDVCLFHEYAGEAYATIKAKIDKKISSRMALGVITHGSSQWVSEGNRERTKNENVAAMERFCCENADFLVSPSRYLIEWMEGQGWKLPLHKSVIPNFVSDDNDKNRAEKTAPGKITELVFFGRLETRKGVDIFCEALGLVAPSLLANISLTFLGKEDHFTQNDILNMLQHLKNYSGKIKFLQNLNSSKALDYLAAPGKLAVMPSRQENSPCAVAECLERGIPFVASNVGGGPELAQNEEDSFVAPVAQCLAAKLEIILQKGVERHPYPAFNRNASLTGWKNLLAQFSSQEGI